MLRLSFVKLFYFTYFNCQNYEFYSWTILDYLIQFWMYIFCRYSLYKTNYCLYQFKNDYELFYISDAQHDAYNNQKSNRDLNFFFNTSYIALL